MSMPKWNRKPCQICSGSGKDPKNRQKQCQECNGSGLGKDCATCGKEITGSGNFENPNTRCTCQDIPFGAI